MGRPRLPDPIKNCKKCGSRLVRKVYANTLEDRGAFRRRRFCDQACMAAWMEGRIKNPTTKNSRRQSGKAAGTECEACGRTTGRLYVHHVDHNPMNNKPSNLQTLCGSCHRRSHSLNYTGTKLQRKSCEHCSKPVARKGLCNTHLTRLKRHGHPLAKKIKTSCGWVLSLVDL